jgi:hypothetical protein
MRYKFHPMNPNKNILSALLNTTFKNITVYTTFVAEIGVPREIHRPVASQ